VGSSGLGLWTGSVDLVLGEEISATPSSWNPLWDTEFMGTSDKLAATSAGNLRNDPKSVKIDLTGGSGVEIVWKDGHRSDYSFVFLRDACPCALCDDERDKANREPGEPPALAPGSLPMFKAKARPTHAEPVGRYAIRFVWNDGHELGIYSWPFLREHCPCDVCRAAPAEVAQ
jgi:DUF971 family protein